MESEKRNHWEKVYNTKKTNEVSWTQEKPETSLNFIRSFNLPKTAAIIDIGGGDSKLVDFLLEEGYENISVLDISEQAIERAKERLGTKADLVTWIVSDITEFKPVQKYDAWHDRATFHFLTSPEQINQYFDIAGNSVTGYLAIGTFSDKGPDKCSGLAIKKYSEEQLTQQFEKGFEKIRCLTEDHITPFNTIQNFSFCSFKRKLF
ncbi:MAG: class I SAM-dependent methyltransferase [Cytophagaceae bacterium]|nr:class I SAM-dependent methyltransferase [Cytophagaceae bacterium]